ncbi:hypothetical protein PG999_003989 [Apiospora kogelbergensis]|uniref:Uncharacterized protein n=1 Tax=Apiospora kogelbergensis TaxID=1337665 RepID=A0AAW0R585_9PEZI
MGVNGNQSKSKADVNGMLAYGQRQVDRVVSAPTRQKAYDATTNFAQERPMTFAFVVSQSVFSLLPLMLFASFAVSTVVFVLVCGLLFSLFWIGLATLLLVPTLLVTFSVAVLVWLWAVATFLFARRVYHMVPASMRGDVAIRIPGSDGRQIVVPKKGASNPRNKTYSADTDGGERQEREGRVFSVDDVDVDVKSEATEAKR